MAKSLDQKLRRILNNPSCDDFILADAKDADMAMGMAAPGKSPEHHAQEGRFRSLAEYRQLMRDVTSQGLIDIMLMSASNNEVLTIQERLFDDSHVTPAVRANDTTDIWLAAGTGHYPNQPSRPFRTTTIDHAQCGKVACDEGERTLGADLGLYSLTFPHATALDRASLEAYRNFRLEAEAKGFRHFLEVFDPNAPQAPIEDLGRFINDNIARTLAGVTRRGRPIFLKLAYHGPEAMEQLAAYDRSLIPGILGGSAGTTYDAFHQLWEAKKHGARVALYGRKINNAEHQLTFITFLRAIADGRIGPEEAVRAYHGELQKLGIAPYRSLEDDLKRTNTASAYSGGGSGTGKTVVGIDGAKHSGAALDTSSNGHDAENGRPDFNRMTPAEKVAWNRARWRHILGD
jgi:hypothetical protein